MDEIRWELYPLVAVAERSRAWLQLQNHLQLAPKTIDAYGRSLNDFLAFCQRYGIVPERLLFALVAAKKEVLSSPLRSFGHLVIWSFNR